MADATVDGDFLPHKGNQPPKWYLFIIGIVIRSGSRSASISKNKIEAILKKTIVIGRLEGDLPLFVSYSYDHCLRVGNFGRQNAGADTLIGLCE